MRRSFASYSSLLVLGLLVGCSGAQGETDPGFSFDAARSDGAAESSGDDAGGDGGATDAGGDETTVFDAGEDTTPSFDAGDTGSSCVVSGCGLDSDCDGIPDSVEGKTVDTDKDGTPDYLDTDSDGDGIPDKLEWKGGGCDPTAEMNDVDGDGTPNFQDLDSDNNGLPDKDEACPPPAVLTSLGMPACATVPYDFDGDGVPDYLDFDNDHDSSKTDKTLGLSDKSELVDNTGTYVGLVDTDGDGIPDLYDRDSDNDGIVDLDDGLSDNDADGKPSFRDKDSDGDGVPDQCEARAKATFTDSDLDLPVLDTDKDGTPDYLDKDSDDDLLADGKEDVNGNCLVDTGETDRLKADTDGDGTTDLVEVALEGGACATDKTCTPAAKGKFYFIEPYSKDGSLKPSPTSSKLALSTTLNKGDVGFVVDTTGSMGGEIANLKSSLATVFSSLKTKIPDLGIGVAGHDDFPYCYASDWLGCTDSYGSSPDLPYYPTSAVGTVTTVLSTAQAAANSLTIHYGDDEPESQVPALYAAITGSSLAWPGGSVGPWTAPAGRFGALQFRSDALPIVVSVSDANFHNGKRALNNGGTSYDGAFQYPYTFTTFNSDQLVAKLNELGAKFVGIASDDGTRLSGPVYGYQAYIADKTGSTVPTSAFGGSCKTGVGGAAVTPDGPGGSCRLVFSISTNGSGLGTSIVDGVYAILASIKFDVYVQAYNDAAETVDVVGSFMQKVEPDPAGGSDPSLGTCITFPSSQLADNFTGPKALTKAADGVNDTIKQVNPGSLYCFNVTPKENTTVTPKADVQTFKAWLKVLAIKTGGGTFTLGADRQVLFVVPPSLN